MLIKVIFSDGSQGMVRSSRLVKLIGLGNVAAYKPFDEWIELRRKQKSVYKGIERRCICPY